MTFRTVLDLAPAAIAGGILGAVLGWFPASDAEPAPHYTPAQTSSTVTTSLLGGSLSGGVVGSGGNIGNVG